MPSPRRFPPPWTIEELDEPADPLEIRDLADDGLHLVDFGLCVSNAPISATSDDLPEVFIAN